MPPLCFTFSIDHHFAVGLEEPVIASFCIQTLNDCLNVAVVCK